jgi:hypothetical protein
MRDKRERFIVLAEARTEKAINSLRLVGNLADRRNYVYSESEAKQILGALEREMRVLRQRFGDGGDSLQAGFKLKVGGEE